MRWSSIIKYTFHLSCNFTNNHTVFISAYPLSPYSNFEVGIDPQSKRITNKYRLLYLPVVTAKLQRRCKQIKQRYRPGLYSTPTLRRVKGQTNQPLTKGTRGALEILMARSCSGEECFITPIAIAAGRAPKGNFTGSTRFFFFKQIYWICRALGGALAGNWNIKGLGLSKRPFKRILSRRMNSIDSVKCRQMALV